MRFAYADPPYYGMSQAFYGHLHDEAHVYDSLDAHRALIDRMCAEFPDGWVLHMAAKNLRDILPLCPPESRVCAWVKGFASFKPGVSLQYAWEPVVLYGGRKRSERLHCVRDWLQESMTLRRGFQGAKPERVVYWALEMLNATPTDDVIDLFPGSGAVSAAIEKWKLQPSLFAGDSLDADEGESCICKPEPGHVFDPACKHKNHAIG